MASNQSKERLLTAAKELFLARGYAATTVDAICEKAALTKGSLYYFFESKEELGLAALEWSLRGSMQILADGPHVRIKDPVEKALAFLEHLEKCSPKLWSGECLLGGLLARTRRDESPHAESRRGHVPGGGGRLRGKTSTHCGSILRESSSDSQRTCGYPSWHC
jgi:AcrR family transcriptional regulator